MGEYFTRKEATDISKSFKHLSGQEFIIPKSGIKYVVYFVVPVPANKEDIEEFRELVYEYLQSGSNNKLKEFDSIPRKDEFIPYLFCRGDIKGGANLLSVSLCPHVSENGLHRYGFEVYPNYYLF